MIIFTPNHGIKEALLFYRPDEYNFYEFNLSSPINYGYSLAPLIPDPEYIPYEVVSGSIDTPDFDVMYGNFIMNNRDQFLLFMSVVLPLYNDPQVCVIIYIEDSPIRNVVMESLMKLIQQRYGYSSYIINDPEDLVCIEDNMSFTPRGILAIQDDSTRALLEGYYGPITLPQEG